jgi:hypothetical protein
MENETAIKYCKQRYKWTKGFDLNLDDPKYFTEKIQWKKFYDHNPLYTITSDKLAIYNYLRLLNSPVMPPKLLGVYNELPSLPDRWVAKATHGSGWNTNNDDENYLPKIKSWLNLQYAPEAGEWGYLNIRPNVIFQERLENISDIKFFIFHGNTKMVQHNRYGTNNTFTNYDVNWNKLDVFMVYPQGKEIPKPQQFNLMKQTAEWLGLPFDFVRIDFMISNNNIYLSEMTHYPTSGFAVIKPLEFDRYLGDCW